MPEIKLKPCPFCGSEDIYKTYSQEYALGTKNPEIFCNTCKAIFAVEDDSPYLNCDEDFKYRSEKTAEAWNKRAELPSSQPEQRWIPCSKRLPPELKPVNVTWINRQPPTYYENLKDKPFTDTAVIYEGKWYWQSAVCVDLLKEYGESPADDVEDAIDIVAWMPLPEPYEEVNRMNDLISRRAAIDVIFNMHVDGKTGVVEALPNTYGEDLREIVEQIETIPRTGKWEITEGYPHNVYCSECHKRFAQTHWEVWEDGSLPRNYCPNCGARMVKR